MTFRDFPAPAPVPLPVALGWRASPEWTYETKIDGCRAVLGNGELRGRARRYPLPGELPAALAGCTLDGELVGSTLYTFDLLTAEGVDFRPLPLRERKIALAELQPLFPAWLKPIPTARPGTPGGEYLAAGTRKRYGRLRCKKPIRALWHLLVQGKARRNL